MEKESSFQKAPLKIFLKVQLSLIFKQLYFFFKNAGENVNWPFLFYFGKWCWFFFKSSQLPKVLKSNDVVWLPANGPNIFVNQKIYSRSCYINISKVDFFHLFCIIILKINSSSTLKTMPLPAGTCLFIFMETSVYCKDMSWSKLFWIFRYRHKWELGKIKPHG